MNVAENYAGRRNKLVMQEDKARTARAMWCRDKRWVGRPSSGVALAKSTDTLLLDET